MIVRLLGTPPGPYNLPKMRDEARVKWPKLEGLNEVNDGAPRIGFYFDEADAPSQAHIDTFCEQHDPTPPPAPPPPPSPEQVAYLSAWAKLRNTFGIARTPAQMNEAVDSLTVILRRIYPREIQ